MASLTIFANFRINDEERLQRMKDSLQSFKDIEAEKWAVNVRGSYKWDAMFYLHGQLGKKLVPYMLESKQGWFHDSRQMLKDISTDFVLFWVEDHMSMIEPSQFSDVLQEMKEVKADYMIYSWFGSDLMSCFKGLNAEKGKHIDVIQLNEEALEILKRNHPEHYLISCVGIFSRDLFNKVLRCPRPRLPRWPRGVPFDFEKKIDDMPDITFRHAFSKYEIFASIDDNMDFVHPLSLQDRGLYPRRVVRRSSQQLSSEVKRNFFIRAWLGILPVRGRQIGRRLMYLWR